MSRTDGNVHGLEPYVNHVLVSDWYNANVPFIPTNTPLQLFCMVIPESQWAAPVPLEDRFDYELLDTAGYVKLWKITFLEIFVLEPNDGDPLLLQCGGYGQTQYHWDRTTAISQPGWGSGVACPLTLRTLPPLPDIAFMTVDHAPKHVFTRSFPRDVVVWADFSPWASNPADLNRLWRQALNAYVPDEPDWNGVTPFFADLGGGEPGVNHFTIRASKEDKPV